MTGILDDLLAQETSKKLMEPSLTPPRPRPATPKELIESDKTDGTVKKKSVHERLGKRATEEDGSNSTTLQQKRTRISLTEARMEEERILGIRRNNSEKEKRKEEKEREKPKEVKVSTYLNREYF